MPGNISGRLFIPWPPSSPPWPPPVPPGLLPSSTFRLSRLALLLGSLFLLRACRPSTPPACDSQLLAALRSSSQPSSPFGVFPPSVRPWVFILSMPDAVRPSPLVGVHPSIPQHCHYCCLCCYRPHPGAKWCPPSGRRGRRTRTNRRSGRPLMLVTAARVPWSGRTGRRRPSWRRRGPRASRAAASHHWSVRSCWRRCRGRRWLRESSSGCEADRVVGRVQQVALAAPALRLRAAPTRSWLSWAGGGSGGRVGSLPWQGQVSPGRASVAPVWPSSG